jgi:hypothetical protein
VKLDRPDLFQERVQASHVPEEVAQRD